jgi:hypothetical protein
MSLIVQQLLGYYNKSKHLTRHVRPAFDPCYSNRPLNLLIATEPHALDLLFGNVTCFWCFLRVLSSVRILKDVEPLVAASYGCGKDGDILALAARAVREKLIGRERECWEGMEADEGEAACVCAPVLAQALMISISRPGPHLPSDNLQTMIFLPV